MIHLDFLRSSPDLDQGVRPKERTAFFWKKNTGGIRARVRNMRNRRSPELTPAAGQPHGRQADSNPLQGNPSKLRELAAWYPGFAERAGNPTTKEKFEGGACNSSPDCMMPKYRYHFRDRDNRIKAGGDMELANVDDAIDKAVTLLKAHPEHHSDEIWHGSRRLCALYSEGPPLGSAAFS